MKEGMKDNRGMRNERTLATREHLPGDALTGTDPLQQRRRNQQSSGFFVAPGLIAISYQIIENIDNCTIRRGTICKRQLFNPWLDLYAL